MKTLILSANTGQGHNSCAAAIRECFESHGDLCVVQDAFGLVSEKLSRSISKNHEKTYRQTPKLSDASYRFLEKHPGLFGKKKLVYQLMSIGSRQISHCIQEGGYDAVICTHVLPAMSLTAAIQHDGLPVKSAFIATDYSCSPGLNGTQLDRYFIPHATLIPDFMQSDIPAEAIVPVGIPVKSAYCAPYDKPAAKVAQGISPERLHLLMMCGSMGCGPIPKLLEVISAQMTDGWEITVICGTNEALKMQLEQTFASPTIHIRGFVREMPQLLASADLYLTKPGGLSTSEAFAAGVPMVLIDAVAGCEENNLRYFVNLGAAVTGDTPVDVAHTCLKLMNSAEQLDSMTRHIHQLSRPHSAEQIWQEMHRIA